MSWPKTPEHGHAKLGDKPAAAERSIMKNQHETPEALAHALFTAAQLAPGEGIEDAVGRLAALVEAHQHARIAELEAQLASAGFTAADMATASAQGFRDGVASIAANAEGPVVNRATVIEWLDANDIEVTDRQLGGLFHFSAPPTAQAEGVEHG